MSKDEQKSKWWIIWIPIIGTIGTFIAIFIAVKGLHINLRSYQNQYSGSMNVIWQNDTLSNHETKTIVICLGNGAISLDSLIVTPTFVNTEDHELKGFSLRFEAKCDNILLTPTSLFKDETPHSKKQSFRYDKEILSAHDKTPPTPFSSIKLIDSEGKCSITSIATYNGIQSAFECYFDVRFFVVPNNNNLSYDQWKRTCDNSIKGKIEDVPYDALYIQNNGVIVQEVKVNNQPNNPISGNDKGGVNTNQIVSDGFSHAFNSDSTCIVFTSKSKDINFVMKLVEGGTYLMGAQFEDASKPNFSSYDERLMREHDFSNEIPVHQVSLNSFYLGETEVTQGLWRYVTGNEPTYGDRNYGQGNDYPVYYVSLEECRSFIKRLNSMTGLNFRLPTEEEWEFAARGGRKGGGNMYAGGNNMDDLGWYCRNSGAVYLNGDFFNMGDLRKVRRDNKNKTHPVKTKCPNELGLYDMSGNVWEMCSNKYYSYLYSIQINNTGNEYVRRGGSWGSSEDFCRVSCRDNMNVKHNATGFRLALSK